MCAIPVGLAIVPVVIVGLNSHGLGKDMWGVPQPDLETFGLFFLITVFLYIILMCLIKLTLCFFYLNIFSGKSIRNLLWATVAFHVLTSVIFIMLNLIAFDPISTYWKRYDWTEERSFQQRCSFIAPGYANAVTSVVSDFWLLAIPLSQVQKLKLHWKKKVGVSFMFLTGACVTVISLLRLKSVHHYENSTNPTWYEWDLAMWSTLEITIGLTCTSLPTVRLILVHFAPRFFGSTRQLSSCSRCLDLQAFSRSSASTNRTASLLWPYAADDGSPSFAKTFDAPTRQPSNVRI
ncbi:hypothetical protein UVI_02040920 [Ustilaginoidea virens]|uniref:Rhodopsin domain-containing protein n=1 Tax=Ustilaginoidea virens TaxID=1159556 RepID=A0A1B5KXD7_USTVR|nr:hypothetical protein UVI_02040920 [Ustilaginoidea virens]